MTFSEAADVDLVEVLAARAPDAHECRRVADRVDAVGGAIDGRAVAHVAIDEPAGQVAAARGARKDDARVVRRDERANDRAADVARAAGHEYFHGVSSQAGARRAPAA